MSELTPLTDTNSVEQRHLQRLSSAAAGGQDMVKGPELLLLSFRTAKTLIERELESLPDKQRSVLSWADYFIERTLSVADQIDPTQQPQAYDYVGPLDDDAVDQGPVCSDLADAIVDDLRNVDPSHDSSALDIASRVAELLHSLYVRMGGLDANQLEDYVYGELESLVTST